MLSFEENEVDASAIFKQDVGNLSNVRNLEDCLSRFSYTPSDRIERREICLIYEKVQRDMEREINHLAHTCEYDAAKELRARLTSLRSEFDALQTTSVSTSHADQKGHFERAATVMKRNLNIEDKMLADHINDECARLVADQELFHRIQWENLENAISRVPTPRVKYSKRCIELLRAEHELIRLSQYDDARKVRKMIERVLPQEEKLFYQAHEDALEDQRRKLRDAQKEDLVRLDEKLKGLKWTNLRKKEMKMKIGIQRIKNHEMDMQHAHSLEKKLRPEMSVKPSALWQRRRGYENTAAALRGSQLLDQVLSGGGAKKSNEAKVVFATTLTDRHDFHATLLDTTTFF